MKTRKEALHDHPSYDTLDGIRVYLRDLDGLHRLAHDRRHAGYDRRETLTSWMLSGRWWLDTTGNLITMAKTDEHQQWVLRGLPEVVELATLQGLLPGLRVEGRFQALPEATDKCDICQRGWTLENAEDAVKLEEKIFRHTECYRIWRARKDMDAYRGILADAVLLYSCLQTIPNGYWAVGAPWARMETPWGAIQLGWRKRVIEITWEEIPARQVAEIEAWKDRERHRDEGRYDKAFRMQEKVKVYWDATTITTDDVTKDGPLVHAWGSEKAVQYLTTLREKLQARPTIEEMLVEVAKEVEAEKAKRATEKAEKAQ